MASPGIILALGAKPQALSHVAKIVVNNAEDIVQSGPSPVDEFVCVLEQRVAEVFSENGIPERVVCWLHVQVVVVLHVEYCLPRVWIRVIARSVADLQSGGSNDAVLQKSLGTEGAVACLCLRVVRTWDEVVVKTCDLVRPLFVNLGIESWEWVCDIHQLAVYQGSLPSCGAWAERDFCAVDVGDGGKATQGRVVRVVLIRFHGFRPVQYGRNLAVLGRLADETGAILLQVALPLLQEHGF
ncbi:uncharacterized protein N7477_004987 [Penicillium maclennaniae]|uniref:uncharacterized protein n=1 Tax=Penicillium maclennaniae TaxID=1343394 RepID=UPI0025414ACE|nr:uncharacterized protein N7477_004987 [Penicillium maclennaniae]KAJ5675053.1 hypothetical protein N7477_004987 [Penicillium maclennaniae]